METQDFSRAQGVLVKYYKNYEWFNKNFEELKQEYPNKIVAVMDEHVIESSTDMNGIKKKVADKPEVYIGSVIIDRLLWIL